MGECLAGELNLHLCYDPTPYQQIMDKHGRLRPYHVTARMVAGSDRKRGLAVYFHRTTDTRCAQVYC